MTTTEEAGKKGAQVRNENLSSEERSEASKKAAETRKAKDPDAFREMGSHSHDRDSERSDKSSGKKDKEEEDQNE